VSTLTGVLGMGRAQAASRFTETFTFFSESLGEIPDGEIEPAVIETVIHADIPGQIKFHTVNVSDREQAGQLVGVQQVMVKVAVGSTPDVLPDHFCRVTASTSDASLVGKKYRVAGESQSGQVSAHRYPVERVS